MLQLTCPSTRGYTFNSMMHTTYKYTIHKQCGNVIQWGKYRMYMEKVKGSKPGIYRTLCNQHYIISICNQSCMQSMHTEYVVCSVVCRVKYRRGVKLILYTGSNSIFGAC